MSLTSKVLTGNLTPIKDRVIVSEMHFGEQTTDSGLIIKDDNGSTRGIYPRWGKVHAKGPENNDPYEINDWVLVEHGRWTRSVKMEIDGEIKELRMVETESVLMWSSDKPDGIQIGKEYKDGETATIDPSSFVNTNQER